MDDTSSTNTMLILIGIVFAGCLIYAVIAVLPKSFKKPKVENKINATKVRVKQSQTAKDIQRRQRDLMRRQQQRIRDMRRR